MKDEEKTKNELISELTELRNRLLKSERSETQLGLAKKLLEENEKSHRTFYEEAPIACFSVDSDGYIKMANQTATAFLGYTSGELVDRQMLDLFVGISIEKAREILALVQAGEEIRGGELEMRRADGSQVFVRAWVKPVRDKGRIIGSRYAVIDVTDLKLAQEELALSEQNFRNSLENSPLGIRIATADGQLLYANKTILDIYGYSSIEELKATPVKQRYTRESYVEYKERIERRKRGEFITDYDIRIVRKDGEVRHLSVCRKAVVWNGELQFLLTYQDITERKKAQQRIEQAAKEWRETFDAITDMVSIHDRDFKIMRVNKSFANAFNMKPHELIGKTCYELIHGTDEPVSSCPHKQSIATGKPVTSEFFEPNLGINIEAYTAPIINEDGEFIASVHLAKDITERKCLEEEQQRAAKLESVGTLAGGIAHDFNNLLTGIMGNISLAKRHVEPKGKAEERLLEAEKASIRARDLTQQLLTFSRGGAPIKKTVSITGLLKESVGFALRGSNISCDFDLPEDLWPVEVDEGQINQIITNMVINAQEAMPEGGVININARNTELKDKSTLPLSKGRYVKITVVDQGVGIRKEHLDKIFDPYFTTKQKGSGLGLATSYSIVKAHGGYITVDSNPTVGTAFQIYLPASKKPAAAVEETKAESVTTGEGRILVMDDEEMVRDLLYAELTEVGYNVELASDGAEAIDRYSKAKESGQPFDAVIMDLTIPGGMGGKIAIKKLLEIDPQAKAIVSSGYATDPVMSEYDKYGFKGVVTKPYRVAEIEKTLQSLSKKK